MTRLILIAAAAALAACHPAPAVLPDAHESPSSVEFYSTGGPNSNVYTMRDNMTGCVYWYDAGRNVVGPPRLTAQGYPMGCGALL